MAGICAAIGIIGAAACGLVAAAGENIPVRFCRGTQGGDTRGTIDMSEITTGLFKQNFVTRVGRCGDIQRKQPFKTSATATGKHCAPFTGADIDRVAIEIICIYAGEMVGVNLRRRDNHFTIKVIGMLVGGLGQPE